MTNQLLSLLTGGAAVGSATVGGVFYAFSTFVMPALRRLPAARGTAAMQQINITAVRPGLMSAMFGTAALCVAVAVWTGLNGSAGRRLAVFAAAGLYLGGTIGSTMGFNVPLNNRLAALVPEAPDSAAVWADYQRRWTAGNHVRSAAAIAAAALFAWSLTQPAD